MPIYLSARRDGFLPLCYTGAGHLPGETRHITMSLRTFAGPLLFVVCDPLHRWHPVIGTLHLLAFSHVMCLDYPLGEGEGLPLPRHPRVGKMLAVLLAVRPKESIMTRKP